MKGSKQRRGSRRRGRQAFTAMEVVMVITLLAALLSLLIPLFVSMQGTFLKRPALEQVQRAFAEAHQLAQVENRVVFLHYDADSETLRLTDEEGHPRGAVELPKGEVTRLRFHRVKPEREITAEPSFETEEHPLRRLPFAPFGTVAVEATIETAHSATRMLFDPFSPLAWHTLSE